MVKTTDALEWILPRAEDRARWWVRDQLYTAVPRTPLADSVITPQWDEAVLCIADELQFPDSRGFNARTVNGYTYLSPMTITDSDLIHARLARFLAAIERLGAGVESDLQRYAEEQNADWAFWENRDLGKVDNLMTLLEYWRRALLMLDRAWKLHFLIVFPRHVLAGMVINGARELAGVSEAHIVGNLTQAHGRTRQADLDRELWALAGQACATGLAPLILENEPSALMGLLEGRAEAAPFLERLRQFLATYGHRAVLPLELSDPTWFDDPTPILGTIKAYVAQGGNYDFDGEIARLEKERDDAIQTVLSRIAEPSERARFEQTLMRARIFQRAMEDDNFHFLRANVLVRYVAREMGRRLAAAGALDSADDVFFLRRPELESACVDLASGVYPLDGFAKLARERRAAWGLWRQTTPPDYLGDLPDEITDFMLTQFWGVKGRRHLDASPDAVTGLGASNGVAEGPARLVISLEDFSLVEPGDIVVCRSTNPAWTPLFTKIAGIVTDQGGTLSHAAVVAREYGIPAVLGTIQGTRRLKTGQRLRIDGASGRVDVLTS